MKITLKKSQWFVIATLCFVVTTSFLAVSCDKSETLSTNHTNGVVVGYTKCNFNSADTLIGLFIITEKEDSLLSFNLNPSVINIDPDLLYYYGVHDVNGGNISFDYRISVGQEIKQILCPQDAMSLGFTHGIIEDYTQIIIINIKK